MKSNYVMVTRALMKVLPDHLFKVFSFLATYGEYDKAEGAYVNCWPSVATLAREMGKGERPVQRAIRELERLGLVVPKPRPGTSTVYWVRVAGAAVDALVSDVGGVAGDTPSQQTGVSLVTGVGVSLVTPNQEPLTKNPKEGASALGENPKAETGLDSLTSAKQSGNVPAIETDLSKPVSRLERLRRERSEAQAKLDNLENTYVERVITAFSPVDGRAAFRSWAAGYQSGSRFMDIFLVALDSRDFGRFSKTGTLGVALSKLAQNKIVPLRSEPGLDGIYQARDQLLAIRNRIKSMSSDIAVCEFSEESCDRGAA